VSLNQRKEHHGRAHINRLNSDVAAVADTVEKITDRKDVGTGGGGPRDGQVTAAWAVFAALGSRLWTLKRRYSALAADLAPSEQALLGMRSGLAGYPRPTQAQLLALIDQALDNMSVSAELWDFLSGQGALLMISDMYSKAAGPSRAVDDALALIAELRDFIGDIYADVPVHRLKATMRQVRGILEDVTG
jgi:hypothetical protein